MSELLPIKDPVLVFALVAMLILLSPIVIGRYRLPGMIGLLLAGAVLGPNAAGVLARDQSFVLFGTVGLLYIMFTGAIEIDMAVLKRSGGHSIVFGLLTFAIPQGSGTLLGRVLGFDWPAAILLGSVFASHTLLAYPIASRLGLVRNPAVTTTVGGTILTDTLALLVLAVVAGATRGEVDEMFWYRLGIGLAIYVAVILLGLPRFARWFFRSRLRKLEKLLRDRHYTLMVSRAVEPLNTCHRVVLAIPPNADHEHGFSEALSIIKRLARQLGTDLLVLTEKGNEAGVRKRVQAIKPAVDVKARAMEHWSSVTQAISDSKAEGDLVVLYGRTRRRAGLAPSLGQPANAAGGALSDDQPLCDLPR